jgi:arylsulfatase A-like enzyme/cytochrome c-type biogenesis protein CcmH/NrfG
MKKWLITGILVAACVTIVIVAFLSRRAEPLNVLLISLDTLRPDHLGCYGYEDIETPNIDGLAEEGVLFEDAITSVPLTLPSHASAMTGLYPITHGIRDNGTFILHDQFTSLAEMLSAEGYETGAFVGTFVLDSRYGLDQGFETYDDLMEQDPLASAFSHPERTGDKVTASASGWLRDVEEPFFGFVHYYDPHTRYEPPPPYDTLYAGRPYDGEIAFTDGEVGRVLDLIKERGLLERTIVVLMSDHGEGLNEHNEIAHGILTYETCMKVALIARVPETHRLAGEIEAPRRVDQVVELIDVMPTVLDLLGMDLDFEIDGRSLVPLMTGASLPPRVCYFESLYPYFSYRWSPLRGVRFNKWKYILAPEPELYNLKDDPHELKNVHESEPERAEQLKEHLLAYAGREGAAPAADVKLSPEEIRKLKALGYVSAWRPDVPTDIEPKGADPKYMIVPLQEIMASGMTAFDKKDFDTARGLFSEMADIDPGNTEAHVFLGRTLMELGELELAEAEFMRVLEIDSTHSQAFFRLGNISRRQGDLDRALFFYQIAARILPETPETISNIGSILMEKGLVDSAMVMLNESLKIDPRDQIALINMGLGHLHMERYDEALQWFHSTLSVNPEHTKALVNIAHIYIERGVPDSTIAYLERARDVNPGDAKMFQNLGNAYRQKGMVTQAAEAFEEAVEIEPENVLALFGLAATKAEEGKNQESIALLDKILKIDPDFAPASQAREHLTSGS